MSIGTTTIGGKRISRVILGGNPFSGYSHQSPEVDARMTHYYSSAHIKEEFRRAEALGVTTHIGRADHHIMRVLMEYWDEGGKIQWIAQTCPELGPTMQGAGNGIQGGAVACFIHGGRMDWLLANNQLDEAVQAMAEIRKAGLAAGINTFFGRTDNHVIRLMEEYWGEGGKIQWIAQTASEIENPERAIARATDKRPTAG
jgi:hypothetical protein